MLNYYLSRCLRRYRHAMRVTVMLKQPDHQLPLVLWIRRKAGAMPSDVQRGALPLLWFSKREKVAEKFHRPYAPLFGADPGAAITVTFAFFGCAGWGAFN